ncbi:MAG: ornithine cyclodeaminase family protein [Clostridia bacterium]|nr:ornithine cyclodeaminase family protein [Clostridia bacterium]
MLKFFDKEQVERLLDPKSCTALMEETLKRQCAGDCTQYVRTAIDMPNTNVLGLMPAYFENGYFGAKVISVYHTNAGTGYPSHQGEILLFAKEHGNVLSVTDAMSVTRIRTGCVSAVASKALANPDSKVLAILGCGAQGHSHLAAISECFPLTEVRCWDAFPACAEGLARVAEERGLRGVVCATAEEAVRDADIICTVTPAHEPILRAEWVKPGAHINAVGACAPKNRELDSDLMAKARVYCDHVESVFKESGDFLIPLKEGRYGEDHLIGPVGDVLRGVLPGRGAREEITVFKALGMAVEDIACAVYLYEREQ